MDNEMETLVADIRNKLTPMLNLVAMLETSKSPLHDDPQFEKIIREEMERVKINVNYLSNLHQKNSSL